MKLHDLFFVAGYEMKQQSRSWVFRVFVWIALIGIVACHVYWQGDGICRNWKMVALPCSMPLMNAYLFGVLQSLFLIVMMADVPRRLFRQGAKESLFARPVGNVEYYWGVMAGILALFWLPYHAHGTLDYLASGMPNLFSDMVGHVNLSGYLLHWSAYLLLGLGFLALCVKKTRRLPNSVVPLRMNWCVVLVLVLAGLGCGMALECSYHRDRLVRTDYWATFERNWREKSCRVRSHAITLEQEEGEPFIGRSLIDRWAVNEEVVLWSKLDDLWTHLTLAGVLAQELKQNVDSLYRYRKGEVDYDFLVQALAAHWGMDVADVIAEWVTTKHEQYFRVKDAASCFDPDSKRFKMEGKVMNVGKGSGIVSIECGDLCGPVQRFVCCVEPGETRAFTLVTDQSASCINTGLSANVPAAFSSSEETREWWQNLGN